jgi:hypothetical protein
MFVNEKKTSFLRLNELKANKTCDVVKRYILNPASNLLINPTIQVDESCQYIYKIFNVMHCK